MAARIDRSRFVTTVPFVGFSLEDDEDFKGRVEGICNGGVLITYVGKPNVAIPAEDLIKQALEKLC